MVGSAVFGAALGTGTALLIAMTIVVYKYYNRKRKSEEWHSLDRMPFPSNVEKSSKPFYPLPKTLYTDAIMGLQVNRAAKLVSKYGTMPVYYYCFTFQGRYSHFYLPGTNTVPGGVVHHDDLIYMYFIQVLFPRFGEESPLPEIDMVEKLTTLHANFARTGNPTPGVDKKLNNVQWDRFTMDSQKYLDIGNTLRMKERLFDDRFQFWDKLYPL